MTVYVAIRDDNVYEEKLIMSDVIFQTKPDHRIWMDYAEDYDCWPVEIPDGLQTGDEVYIVFERDKFEDWNPIKGFASRDEAEAAYPGYAMAKGTLAYPGVNLPY